MESSRVLSRLTAQQHQGYYEEASTSSTGGSIAIHNLAQKNVTV
jgi:hypothetical protein